MDDSTPRLDGQAALVTGAAHRIGAAIARRLHAAGMNLAIHYLSSATAAEILATELNGKRDGSVSLHNADLLDPNALKPLVEEAAGAFGRLDLLVNNAGINVAARHWNAGDLGEWDRLVEINVKGVYYCVSAALPIMRRQQDGLIINVSSWAGRHSSHVAREILGGVGIMHDYPIARHFCNIESVYTYEGTDDIHTLVLGHRITGLPAYS